MASCIIGSPTVNQATQETSRLFPSLLDFFKLSAEEEGLSEESIRRLAQESYVAIVDKSSTFIKDNKKQLEFDENGEPTLESVLSLLRKPKGKAYSFINTSGETLLSNDRSLRYYKAKAESFAEYSREITDDDIIPTEGIPKYLTELTNTNKKLSEVNFIAIPELKDGKLEVSIVERTIENEAQVEKFITDFTIYAHIKKMLLDHGIEISNTDFLSSYSLKDLSDGVSGIIELNTNSRTQEILTKDLAILSAFTALNMLGKDHSLVKRLLDNVVNEEVQKKILGLDLYNNTSLVDRPLLAAATLIGERIINIHSPEQSKVSRLLSRIIEAIKRAFYTLTDNKFQKALSNARVAASKIISKTTKSGRFRTLKVINNLIPVTDEIDISRGNQEHKNSKTSFDYIHKAFSSITSHVDTFISKVKSTDKKAAKDILSNLKDTFVLSDPGVDTGGIAFLSVKLEAIRDALELLATYADEYREVLAENTIESLKEDPSIFNQIKCTKNIAIVNSFIQGVSGVLLEVNILLDKLEDGSQIKQEIQELYNILNTLHGGLSTTSKARSFEIFKYFLANVYGSEFINRSQRMVFNGTDLVAVEASQVSLSSYLEDLYQDDNFFSRYLASMSNSNDIINQIVEKAVFGANDSANSEVRKYWDIINDLTYRMKEDGIDHRKFFATDGKGNLTGYYVDPEGLDWGAWDTAWEEFRAQKIKEFNEEHGHLSNDIERVALWDNFFRMKAKEWYKRNSKYDKTTERYKPSPNLYSTSEYSLLSEKEKEYLKEILEIKHKLDEKLEYISSKGETVEYSAVSAMRAPQFRGSMNNRIQNLNNTLGYYSSSMSVLRDLTTEAFVETSDDTDFGSENTLNNESDILAHRQTSEFHTRVNRLTTYGINKLKNMSQLTTDISAGLLQYSVMACNYEAMSQIVDALEIGDVALSGRRINGEIEGVSNKISNAHGRYRDFLHDQVYGIHTRKLVSGSIVWNKVLAMVAKISRYMFLGWNTFGGLVNLLNGFFEMFKESLAGSTLNLASFTKANGIYTSELPDIISELGLEHKNNKLSLFMREFDVQGDFKLDAKTFTSRNTRVRNLLPIGHNYLWPYKSGDHYMQAISYIAVASDLEKFAFINTKQLGAKKLQTLWESLEVVPVNPAAPKGPKTIRIKEGYKLITPEGNLQDFGKNERAAFMKLCRETNNRMHGIYNSADKTALHRYALGSLILSMKGYALGMIERRFTPSKYSIALGQEIEGSYLTALKYLVSMFNVRKFNPLMVLYATINPFSRKTTKYMINKGFNISQIENMRRNFGDVLIIALNGILRGLSAPPPEEELPVGMTLKEWKAQHQAMGILHYLSTRLYFEQSAFTLGIKPEAASLLSIIPPGFSAMYELGKFAGYGVLDLTGITEYEEDETAKSIETLQKYDPWSKNYNKIMDPWTATDNYEYIRYSNR